MKKDKSILIFIASAITGLYLTALSISFFKLFNEASLSTESVGIKLVFLLSFVHYVLVFIGLTFSSLGAFGNNRVFVLVGAILYTVSLAIMPLYFLFMIVQVVLSYVGYSQMEKNA